MEGSCITEEPDAAATGVPSYGWQDQGMGPSGVLVTLWICIVVVGAGVKRTKALVNLAFTYPCTSLLLFDSDQN